MLLHKSLPKQADIFKRSNNYKFYNLSYKPFINIKKAGIITSFIVVLVGFAVLLTPAKQATKTAQAMMACSFQSNNGNGCNHWWHYQNANWQDNNGSNNYGNNNNSNNDGNNTSGNSGNVNDPISPIPQNNFTVNTTPFTSIQPQVQTISTNTTPDITQEPNLNPIAITQPLGQNTNQPTGQNQVGPLSDQIIATQQQISQQMQTCVANALQLANQIAQMQGQQNQLQNQLNASYSQQQPNFDLNTQQGQQQQQAWQQQQQQKQQQLQNQINAISNATSNAQTNAVNANNKCQQQVSQLEQNRGTQEQNLDQVFNQGMNIQITPPPSPSQ